MPTNYHLYDFMGFDEGLSREESLWKAWTPTKVYERCGDICFTVPFQKQKRQNDMAPETGILQECHTLTLRAYRPDVIRLFISMCGDEMSEKSDMLQFSPEIVKEPLALHKRDGLYTITDSIGRVRATLDTRSPQLDHWSDLLPPPQPTLGLTLYPDGDAQKPVRISDDHFSPPRYDGLALGYCLTEGHEDRATLSFEAEHDECFVGTGERFRKMDLSGQTFYLRNQDGQGVNNRRCYKNIPFYLSSRMYGAFYHTSDYCKLSLADHSTRSVQFLCDRATLDTFLIGGNTPERILYAYRMLTGFPSVPPLWSYGIWMSRMTYFSADEVEEICDRLRREHYPCDVIHLDTGWFRTDWLCEWKFNADRFPDPGGFIHRLLDKGFRVSLWQLPYVAQGAEQLEEAQQNSYIGKREQSATSQDGSNFSALDYAGTIDFTYDKAIEWYKNLLRRLLQMGVKCIKTDFGENIHLDATYQGLEAKRLNNLYALLYQRAAYEVTKEETGDGIIWARAGWAGCHRYPLHWGGDSASNWNGMAGSLRGGLHIGLSGFAFWSHDVPGFHSLPDFMNSPINPEVYVRWTQMGVFTSHLRYHGTCKREPWHYPTVSDIVRRWWQLRYHLIPYIVEQGEACTKSGYPMIRALLMEHPHDRQCWHTDDEYYFGREFLVAPVMNSEGRRDIYLPVGRWIHFFTGEHFEGGRWHYNIISPLDIMPVFVRPGSQIAIYPDIVECTDEMDLSQTITIEVDEQFKGIFRRLKIERELKSS